MKLKLIAKRAVTVLLTVVSFTGCLTSHAANNETAMGIMGHSSDSRDVMYPNRHNNYALSSKDIGQLKLYYYIYRGLY